MLEGSGSFPRRESFTHARVMEKLLYRCLCLRIRARFFGLEEVDSTLARCAGSGRCGNS